MVDPYRGLKAGAVSGVIYGAVNVIVNVVVMGVMLTSFFPEFFVSLFGFAGTILVTVLFIAGLFTGGIIGFFFGFIFALLYKELPGRTSVLKGAIFGLLPWIILGLALQLIIGPEFLPPEVSSLIAIPIIINLGTSIFWGILLGYFWDRFSPKTAT